MKVVSLLSYEMTAQWVRLSISWWRCYY